ncbi:tryptamine 5-hydroxylase-like, partial [Telopea speciosissima]|uniref:tryptamine 5-hydroxylase-like n=1 Tax=Telopea speciosissima TaxID=54955 RepID=UPI001CC6D986
FFIKFILKKLKPSQSQKHKRLPPSPPKLPILGHLHHLLQTDMPHHTLSHLATQLGPIIYLQLGGIPTLVISSAQLARQVLKTHDHAFASRPQLIAAQFLSFGCSDITFSRYGPYWRQTRKICVTHLLSTKRVNSFQLIRDEEVNRLLRSISSESETDMSERLLALSNNVLCRVAFGRRFLGENHRLPEILTETQALLAGFSLGDFFPGMEWLWLNKWCGLRRRLENNLRDLRRVCDEIIGEHEMKKMGKEGDEASSGEEEDFVDVLLRVQGGGDLEVPITDDNLKALVLDMFVAGTDTTAATLEWTMTELARHPEVMEKAQLEVRKVARSDGTVQEHHLHQLHYLKAVIKETLRLHHPVPLLVPRESIEKCTLDDDGIYEIPAKTRVLINAYAIGRDPQYWDNPLDYNPERFITDTNIDVKDQDFRLLPFGGGRRGCPGYSFALATIEIALARLLYHFDWALPLGVTADDVDLTEIFGLATRKKVALVLLPISNKDYEFKGNYGC